MTRGAELRHDAVILAGGISAGIHGALAPRHFGEGKGEVVGFLTATVVLALVAVALTRHPDNALPLVVAALVFAGLIASYAFATTSGVPVLHSEPEPVGGLALATKVIEAIGLLAASSLIWRHAGVADLTTERNLK